MPLPRRLTQKDVAIAAKVDRATVSLSLRDHPSIPASTRERVKKVAAKLGYTPDPMLAALANYRSRHRPKSYHGTIGWIAHTTPDYNWKTVSHFATYHQSAITRAETHGFQVEIIDVGHLEDSWSRAASVARARGIHGLLLCPQPAGNTTLEQFPWERFSAVTFGYSLLKPRLHSVASAQYHAALLTMEKILARGYRRIGFSSTRSHDQRTNHNFLAGYLAALELAPEATRLPIFLGEAWNDPLQENWYWEHRPDAILACDIAFPQSISRWKKRLPSKVGIACPLIPTPDSPMAGVWEDNSLVGEAAVDFLVSLMHRSERGVPRQPQRLLIEGVWVEGKTLSASA